MEQLSFKLEVFEGPLDLLLYLISKHKLDIMDIEITSLLEQYLSYIDQMKMADLEIASSFLEMAARLVYIKTVSLLPKHEEAEELKRELSGELLELSAIKSVDAKLAARNLGDRIFVRAPQPVPVDTTYHRVHHPEVLVQAYLTTVGKQKSKLPPSQNEFTPLVRKKVVSVASRIFYLLRRLYAQGQAKLEDCFVSADRSEVVATFLAVLELVKSHRVTLSDDNQMVYFNKEKVREQNNGNQPV